MFRRGLKQANCLNYSTSLACYSQT